MGVVVEGFGVLDEGRVGGGGVAGGSSLASVLRASGLVAVAAGFRANTSPMIKSKSKPVTLPSCYSCCASIHDKLMCLVVAHISK